MVKPVKPTVPAAPSRSSPSTFADQAEAYLNFIGDDGLDYIEEALTYVDERKDAAIAASVAAVLGSVTLSSLAGKVLSVNSAGTQIVGADPSGFSFASETEAEQGSNNTKAMSPLRTKQAIDEQVPKAAVGGPWEEIERESASSSPHITFDPGDFDATRFTDYCFVFDSIRPSTDGAEFAMLASADNGGSHTRRKRTNSWASVSGLSDTDARLCLDVGNATDESGVSGELTIYDFHADKGAMTLSRLYHINSSGALTDDTMAFAAQRPSMDDPLNWIRFGFSSGTIQSGTITLIGRRSS